MTFNSLSYLKSCFAFNHQRMNLQNRIKVFGLRRLVAIAIGNIRVVVRVKARLIRGRIELEIA